MAGRISLRTVVAGGVAGRDEVARIFKRRQTTAGKDEHAVWTLGPDSGGRSDDVPLTTPVLRPSSDEIVGAGHVTPALYLLRLRHNADG